MADSKISIISQSPYYDDFDPNKDYLRVLFRPSFPVQARELSTVQSFLQEQIARFGDNIFKDGARITAGEITIETGAEKLVLSGTGNLDFPPAGADSTATLGDISTLEGKIITDSSGVVKAQVIKQPTASTATATVGNLFIKYLTGDKFPTTGGYIYALADSDNPTSNQKYYNTFSAKSACTLGNIAEGVYYAKGVFTRVAKQTVVVSSTSATPSAQIGFTVQETIVTQNDDSTLYDNARGTTNEGAPGAHRLKIVLNFSSKSVDAASDSSFYRVMTIEQGRVKEIVSISQSYNVLLDVLAKRTYDESGHYALTPFNQVVSAGDSDAEFKIKIAPARAYVSGYEVSKLGPTNVKVDKGLSDTKTTEDYVVPFEGTTSVSVTNVTGVLPGHGVANALTPTNALELKDTGGNIIGVAHGYTVRTENEQGATVTKLYLFDIRMFTVLTLADSDFITNIATGNDVTSLKTRGTVYKEKGTAGIADSLTVINSNGKFKLNQTISSSIITDETTISAVNEFTTGQIASVSGGTFTADITANTFEESAGLVQNTDSTIRQISDNAFTLLEYGTSPATNALAANGNWDFSTKLNDDPIQKSIKFAYVRIKNETTRASNYGWSASDKEVSLFYPDVHKVYKVNESSDSDVANARFARITITTSGVIPQGAVVTGATSGTKAIVALSNSTTGASGSLASTAGYHDYEVGTGSNSTLEIIYQKGVAFTAGESITVESPSGVAAYNFTVTHVSNTSATGSDVTGLFLLDDGQREDYYDTGRLVRKDRSPAPNKDIVVFYSYFERDNLSKSYYSAESYANLDFFGVDPRYYGTTQEILPKTNDDGIDLRNAIDFRLTVETNTNINQSPFNFNFRTFEEQGRVYPQTTFTMNLEEYLGRTDLLLLNKQGEFVLKKGVPSVAPKTPVESPSSMTISTLRIPPAVRYPEDEVNVEMKDNRRYTMRDIGDIDTRVRNLEKAVALSLLESQALHDNVDNRTKSGFVVDDFSVAADEGITPADSNHEEFVATIDVVDKMLLPAQTEGTPIPMEVTSRTNLSNFYDDWIINEFTEETMVEQPKATGTHLINPFAVWTFRGFLKITPDEQHWRIDKNNYFIRQFGQLNPVGETEYNDFARINVNNAGGVSSTVSRWVGGTRRRRQGSRVISTRALRTTTTIDFGRPVAAGEVRTLTGSTIIPNPQDYRMRPDTISYTVSGLKVSTLHDGFFGDIQVVSGATTDAKGGLSGSFTIPANTVPAGTENFVLRDRATNGSESIARAPFRSIGHLDEFSVVQNTATSRSSSSTRTVVTRIEVDDDRGDGGDGGGGGDPIAQLFTMPFNDLNSDIQTSIITSIDVWFGFVDTRPSMDKVLIEIVETKNGYPGGPADIIGTTGFVDIGKTNEVTNPTSANATNLKFLSPVVLREKTEYAIVIKSPSNATTVFIAELGGTLTDGSGIHTSQPLVGGYAGSFFVSQNSSTWEPMQNMDLSFKLNRAKFDTTKVGVLSTVNSLSNTQTYRGDIGAFNQGLAIETFDNSPYVMVFHPNHGLNFDDAKVTLSGLADSDTFLNGIPVAELEKSQDVLYPTLHTYFVKTTTSANASGKPAVGTFTAFATQCIAFDSMISNLLAITQENDQIGLNVTTTTTSSINLQVANNKIANSDLLTPFVDSPVAIPIQSVVEFDNPKIVRNQLNATTNDLQMTFSLLSGNQYSSPYFKNSSTIDPLVFRNTTGNFLTDSDLEGLTTRAPSLTDDDVTQEYVSYLAGVQSEAEHSAYVTKEIDLEIPADGFTILFDADMEPSSMVEAAFKVRPVGDSTPFSDLEWIDFPASQQVNESNYGPFTSGYDLDSYTMRVEAPFEFNSFKIRLRLRTTNEALIPRVKDLRIIADI